MHLKQLAIFIFSVLLFADIHAQDSSTRVHVVSSHIYDSILRSEQQKALDILSMEDTTAASPCWPNIKPELFFANVKKNVLFPYNINQGKSTNFCGYAALTHLLVKYHPELYVQYILALYHNGNAVLRKKTLKPSDAVRQVAGSLKNKGDLDVLHADQLWFLTLADQFKGYMNATDHKYNPGDENKIWAGTNYGKFDRMLADFAPDKLTSRGSDLLRPSGNFYKYISSQLDSGVVLLYVNSKYLYPHKYSFFKLRAPTHFIVVYNMYKTGDMIEFQYWDYGRRTEQQITGKRLHKLVFGITTIDTHEIHYTN
jgi:hypothetical protein